MKTITILVEVKNVYGEFKAYPANAAAEILAQIAGTKTLTRQALALAERMGLVVEQKQTAPTLKDIS